MMMWVTNDLFSGNFFAVVVAVVDYPVTNLEKQKQKQKN